MGIEELKQKIRESGADLTRCAKQRLVGTVPLQDGHKIEVYAPVAIFFDKDEAVKSGQPCYVIGRMAQMGGSREQADPQSEKWSMIYTSSDADLGFVGTEEEIAARLIEYLKRNWRGMDPAIDSLIDSL